MSVIDTEKVTEAILATSCSPLALESAAGFVEHWIDQGVCADKKIVAVEMGFVLPLDPDTIVIGVQDLLTDEEGIIGNEWKTTKEKTRYWNQDQWFDSISSGSQVAIYALALQGATYYERDGTQYAPKVDKPRIRVRAISKSSPPVIWPTRGDEILTFCQKGLDRTRAALLAKAASIRAMRLAGSTPWQLPGIWCTNQFRRQCDHYNDCLAGKGPEGFGVFAPNDPAFDLALPHIGNRRDDSKLVILGASMYSTASECVEKYRRATITGDAEESLALDVGGAFHSGVAEWYRQLREQQKKG